MTADFAHHRERWIRTGDPSALRDMLAHVTPANESRSDDQDHPTSASTGSLTVGQEFDQMIREAVTWFLVWPWAPVPAEMDGSRLAWAMRTLVQGLIVFAVIYGCLGIAGVVHG